MLKTAERPKSEQPREPEADRKGRKASKETRRLQLIEDLCAGLGYAHKHKLVHRDIKPANLIIDSSTGGLKILDFGVVRRLGSASTVGVPVGTFCYMSPEQTKGAANLDHRSDIFAVGLVFYELMTGKKAFPPGKSIGDLVAGTWVVQTARGKLGVDLAAARSERQRRVFSEAALDLYGVYELQTLEDVLRQNRPDAVATVAGTIRRKADIADDGDDYGFLSDYYAALCARLERGMMLGEFHSMNDSPGLRNPEFRPLRSPVPMLAIRLMVESDLPFMTRDQYTYEERAAFLRSYLYRLGSSLKPARFNEALEKLIVAEVAMRAMAADASVEAEVPA